MSAVSSSVEKFVFSSAEKSSTTNIMCSKSFNTMKLIDARKEPTNEYDMKGKRYKNKHLWKRKTLSQLFELQNKENRAILTGKLNNCIVIDLDFYSKWDKKNKCIKEFDRSQSKFIKDFGEDYIKRFNTLTFKTANGGEHLVFNYTPKMKTTANREHNIDVRSDGGYIVAPGSVIDKSVYNPSIKKNKRGYYLVANDTEIKDLPIELETWMCMNVYNKKRISTKPLKKVSNGDISSYTTHEAYEQDEVDLTEYSYLFDDDVLIKILDGLPDDYFIDSVSWYIFTTAMKTLGKQELWDKYSKEKGGDTYDREQNIKRFWDNAQHRTYLCLENVLENSTFVDDPKIFLGYFKLKLTNIHNTKPDITLDGRKYLDEDDNGYFFEKYNKRFTLVRSDTGTGKTTAFKNYIDANPNKRFISVVSRVSLGEEQTKVFKEKGIECEWHEDISNQSQESNGYEGWWMYEGTNIVTTIDSVIKMSNWEDFNDYVIYLDEYNSLIEYFVDCPNLCDKRIAVWTQFNKMIQEADRVIMTDADISDNSIGFIKGCDDVEQDEIQYINNPYKHNNGKLATELFTYTDLIKKIAEQEKGAMICLDSKAVGEKLVDDMKQKYDIDIKYYSSDTTEPIDLDAHKFVAFSPKVVYGLDSLMERAVFCYYKCQTISPVAMVQQVNRNRKITHLYYLFESKTWKAYKYDTIEEVEYEIKEGSKMVKTYNLMNYDCTKCENERFNRLLATFRYTLDCYATNKFAHFLKIIQERGFTITNFMDFNSKSVQKSSGFLTKLKKELQEKKQLEIEGEVEKKFELFKEFKDSITSERDKIFNSLITFGNINDDPEINKEKLNEMYELYQQSQYNLLKECTIEGEDIHISNDEMYDEKRTCYQYYRDQLNKDLDARVSECITEATELFLSELPECYLKIIRLLKVPLEEYVDERVNRLIRDPQALEKYFRTIEFFSKDCDGLQVELSGKDDFDSQKYQSSKSRFIILNKLIDAVGMKDNEDGEMIMTKIMTKDQAEKLQKEYCITFRNRSKKLDFNFSPSVKTTIVRIYKLLFGDDIIETQQTSKSVNGKTKKITKHKINYEWIAFCKWIRAFKVNTEDGDDYECDTTEI